MGRLPTHFGLISFKSIHVYEFTIKFTLYFLVLGAYYEKG
jgi:hypothetical protein